MVACCSVPNTLRRPRLYGWTFLILCVTMAICMVLSNKYLEFQPKLRRVNNTLVRHGELYRKTRRNGFVEIQGNRNTNGLVKSRVSTLRGNTSRIRLVKSNYHASHSGISMQPRDLESQRNVSQMELEKSTENLEIQTRVNNVRLRVTKHYQRLTNESGSAPDESDGKEQTIVMDVPPWSEIIKDVDNVSMGGRHTPTKGHPQDTVVFIVPYRNRRLHLKLFLKHMHPFLQRQNLGYVIYIVEMDDDVPFNRAVLFNAGFLEVMKREHTSCVVFHDIDMLPTIDKNLYFCDNTVRHYAVAVQQFKYRLPNKLYVGGVLAFPTKYYRAVNGFSNLFVGWGAEDNDLRKRIDANKIPISRPQLEIGRYSSWSHDRDKSNIKRNRGLLVNSTSRMELDGLNNVRYKVNAFEERPLFTWILIQTSFKSDELNSSRNIDMHDNGKEYRLGNHEHNVQRNEHQTKFENTAHRYSGKAN